MTKPMTKPVGHVERLPAGGFVVVIERYASGRRLPEPRIVLDDGKPFATPLPALAALDQWKDAPRSMKRCEMPEAPPVAPPAPVVKAKRVRRRKAKPVVRKPVPFKALPEVVKLMPERPATCLREPDEQSRHITALIERGAVPVTRCLPGMWLKPTHCVRYKNGHMLPTHLDPVTMA